jgi:membrane protein YdbS with pleckstrin-like domain
MAAGLERNPVSYVDKNLMQGEQVVYRTRRHWVIYRWALLVLFAGVVFCVALIAEQPEQSEIARRVGYGVLGAAAAIALLLAISPWIERRTSEFAVTNKRVIVKVGWVQRRSIETLLMKVEGIEVLQGIWGRILNYGTIIITGTGGSKELFERIAAPLEFRRKVQEQIIAMQEPR